MLDLVFAALISLSATCDASAAAAGSCGCGASGSSFTICASKTTATKTVQSIPAKTQAPAPKASSKPKPAPAPKAIVPAKAKSVTNPTSCQEIWTVGKTPGGCSKPKPKITPAPKPKPVAQKPTAAAKKEIETTQDIEDQASAMVPSPIAHWYPGGVLQVGAVARFEVQATETLAQLELFGEPANIRFVPIHASWQISLGQVSGFTASWAFNEPGDYSAQATVVYRVDYRLPGETWVLGAAEITSTSNSLEIRVVDPPRRTLLVG